MDNSQQALTYSRPSSLRTYHNWFLFGYVAVTLLGLAMAVRASLVTGVADASFATAVVLP